MANTGTTRTAAQILVDALKIHGVDTAFCVPGESYLAVLDALYDARDSIRLIVARQDGGAAYMAEAWAKVTGRPGICFVTRGPGATNASIGVHTDRGIGRAGSAGDEADSRPARDLGPGLGHVRGAAVLARDDQADRLARVVERVENREIALAGNAERGVDAVDLERIDENLSRCPGCAGFHHRPQLYLSDAASGPIG